MSRYGSRDTSDARAPITATIIAGLSIAPLYALFAIVPAFVVMLGLGAAHDQWPAIPALGYGTTYILLLAFGILNPFRKGNS